jgi:cell division protein FtsL
MPAVAAWGLGLVFGFGLNYLDVISFYYLFIPTWFFTIAVYTLLASKYGAKETYDAEAKEEEVRNETIERFQEQQAKEETVIPKDVSMLSKGLKFVAISALVATLVLACNVLFGSAEEADYIANRELFYTYAFVCTIIYFVLAYWALKRGKSNHSEA